MKIKNKGKIPESIFKQLEAVSKQVSIPKDTVLMRPGSSVEAIVIPIQGTIRVFSTSENGRSISLFWVEPKETCIIGASCLFNDSNYPAFASAETTVEALIVPVDHFRELFEKNKSIQAFVFDLISFRLMSVMELVTEVAFNKVDSRLAKFLLNRKNSKNQITLTHDEIAQSLGTSREVISRLLRSYATEGWLKQSHSSITLEDKEKIKNLYSCD